MQHAFLAGLVIAILSGALGYFVVLRNLSFASHALGHISFAGATAALLLGISPLCGQLVLTLFSAFLMGILGDRLLKNDMSIGIVLAFALGLGSLFLSLNQGYAGQATSILFGNLLGVSSSTLAWMTVLTLLSVLILAILSRPLLFASVEPELALARGVPLTFLSVIFLCLMAVGVTLASQAVGVLLIFTLLIGPAAIALQWTRQFWSGISLSILLTVLLVFISLFLTYYTNWPLSFWVSALVLLLYFGKSFRACS
ncbi:MAG: metal ABC transporter permease [Gammaproteobacteria bacterium]|nr:metal ABC transporter permease [Gammaproteobacteria bacterium]